MKKDSGINSLLLPDVVLQWPGKPAKILEKLKQSLHERDFDGLRILVAFFKETGLELLRSDLVAFCKSGGSLNCMIGTDFGLTDPAAVRSLCKLQEQWPELVSVKLVKLLGSDLVFHPKIYWFHGPVKHRIVVGSSNMTKGGFGENLEAAAVIELDTRNPAAAGLAWRLNQTWIDIVEGDKGKDAWCQIFLPTEVLLEKLTRYREEMKKLARQAPRHPLGKPRRRRRVEHHPPHEEVRPGGRLVMDLLLEMGPLRMSQVQPLKHVWRSYFGIEPNAVVPPSRSFLYLHNVRTDEREKRPVVRHGHVATLELTGARCPRPAIVEFLRTEGQAYDYAVYTREDDRFEDLDRELKGYRPPGRQVRRFMIS